MKTGISAIWLSFCIVLVFSLPGMVHGAGLPDQQQCRMLWEQQQAIKPVIEGWCVFIDRNRGNCLACHDLRIDSFPENLAVAGNAGPALENLTSSYPDRNDLRNLIHDASRIFPGTIMPLYGKHQILSSGEINLLVKFLMGI